MSFPMSFSRLAALRSVGRNSLRHLSAPSTPRLSGEGKRKTPFPGDRVIIPDTPFDTRLPIDESRVPPFSHDSIRELEELSLVRFSDEQAVAVLRETIARVTPLLDVDLSNVVPMETVWEDQECPLREDIPEETPGAETILMNVAEHRDGYIVAPIGNVPLEEADTKLDIDTIHDFERKGSYAADTAFEGRRTDEKKRNKGKRNS